MPNYFVEPLYAAYLKGAYYVMSLRHAGGWKAVGEAHRKPPESTEQVLHPDKLIVEVDRPTRIDLAPVEAVLRKSGWERIDGAVHGELYLGMLLRMRVR